MDKGQIKEEEGEEEEETWRGEWRIEMRRRKGRVKDKHGWERRGKGGRDMSLIVTLPPAQACALIQSQDEQKIQLLYEFLANASRVYSEVFPLM